MKTLKNSIQNLLFVTLLIINFSANAQINLNNYPSNQPTFNSQPVNVNTGFRTLVAPLMWQVAICDGRRNSCNYDELRMAPITNTVSTPQLFYVLVKGNNAPLQNLRVFALGSGNTRIEIPSNNVTAPYKHNVIEQSAWVIKFDMHQLHNLYLNNSIPNLKLYMEGYVNGEFVSATQNFRVDG